VAQILQCRNTSPQYAVQHHKIKHSHMPYTAKLYVCPHK